MRRLSSRRSGCKELGLATTWAGYELSEFVGKRRTGGFTAGRSATGRISAGSFPIRGMQCLDRPGPAHDGPDLPLIATTKRRAAGCRHEDARITEEDPGGR